ncbi:membrane protease subunit, stomatin/prohibitin [Candidatus Nitrososphaera evergladensis SR1]|uniref:Membrane protease subunit, stomatin/prohibitin n=1 Tax=Candidatus Nitrososphaera evergladensis SR1 TaxID=1459636 RepID=A0A075N273_9ARCH|nr:slipin family protein [Candidatus Nitrososphaera evergladensis]AIF85544.1 membrane protease subunit, stomatin/prohibitin [Candidatus Nitrososphaera evergladensis SR1]
MSTSQLSSLSASSPSLSPSLILEQLALPELIGIGIVVIIFLVVVASSIRIIREYERAIVFRLGRLIGAKGPGLIILIPFIDRALKVDLRVITLDVPKQKIITLDNVTVDVDAVVYLRVSDPSNAVVKVNNYLMASSLLSQTTLRDLIGQTSFDDLLSRREDLNKRMQEILDTATDPWGVKVSSVAIRDVSLPENMHRAIAKQAEAEREKRGRIIIAEGELIAAEKMALAADYYTKNIAALRLRELQTWAEVAREKNMIVVTAGGSGAVGANSGSGDNQRDLGSLLGIIKERTPVAEQVDAERIREIAREELASIISERGGEGERRRPQETKGRTGRNKNHNDNNIINDRTVNSDDLSEG